LLDRDGDISQSFRVENSWIIVQLAGRVEGKVREFESVRNIIKSKIQRERKKEMIERMTNMPL